MGASTHAEPGPQDHGAQSMALHAPAVAAGESPSQHTPLTAIERPRYGRLGALGWLHFLNDGSANYLPGVLPAILISLGLDVNLAGAAMTALVTGQALMLATGWLADRLGGRTLVLVGVIGTSIGGALLGLAPSAWALLTLLVLMGVFNALFHPQAMSAARLLGGNRQGLCMSLYLIGGEIGRGLWPLLASLVVVYLGLHQLWIMALPMLLTALPSWLWLPKQPPRHKSAPRIQWRSKVRPMFAVVSFCYLRALAVFGASTFLPVLWHVRGHSLVSGAATVTVLLLVGIVGNAGGGHWSDRIGRRPVLLISSIASALLLALFLVLNGATQWVVLAILGIMMFAYLPIAVLMGQDLFPQNRSFGSGLTLGFSNGMAGLTLVGLGAMSHVWGVAVVLWLVVGVLAATALVAIRMPCGDE